MPLIRESDHRHPLNQVQEVYLAARLVVEPGRNVPLRVWESWIRVATGASAKARIHELLAIMEDFFMITRNGRDGVALNENGLSLVQAEAGSAQPSDALAQRQVGMVEEYRPELVASP